MFRRPDRGVNIWMRNYRSLIGVVPGAVDRWMDFILDDVDLALLKCELAV